MFYKYILAKSPQLPPKVGGMMACFGLPHIQTRKRIQVQVASLGGNPGNFGEGVGKRRQSILLCYHTNYHRGAQAHCVSLGASVEDTPGMSVQVSRPGMLPPGRGSLRSQRTDCGLYRNAKGAMAGHCQCLLLS